MFGNISVAILEIATVGMMIAAIIVAIVGDRKQSKNKKQKQE